MIGPCGLNTPHIHPHASEIQINISGGDLKAEFILENEGRVVENILSPGMATVFPFILYCVLTVCAISFLPPIFFFFTLPVNAPSISNRILAAILSPLLLVLTLWMQVFRKWFLIRLCWTRRFLQPHLIMLGWNIWTSWSFPLTLPLVREFWLYVISKTHTNIL